MFWDSCGITGIHWDLEIPLGEKFQQTGIECDCLQAGGIPLACLDVESHWDLVLMALSIF